LEAPLAAAAAATYCLERHKFGAAKVTVCLLAFLCFGPLVQKYQNLIFAVSIRLWIAYNNVTLTQSWTRVWAIHGSGWIGLAPEFFPYLVNRVGWVGSNCVGLCGSWVTQNVTQKLVNC